MLGLNKKLVLIITLVVAGALTLFFVNKKDNYGGIQNQENTAEVEMLKETLKEESKGVAPIKGGTAEQTKTYTQLLGEYDGRRIQFDERCQAIPNDLRYKNGTRVMFDNRSGDARYMSLGGVVYYLPGYGYNIVSLSSKTLPKLLSINCGSAVNVGQILIQK